MSQCPNCSKPLSFWDVLRAVNPSSIPCGGCQKRISVDKKTAFMAASGVILLAGAVCWFAVSVTTGIAPLICVVLGLGFVVEGMYYLLIKKGMIKSDLKPSGEGP